MIRVGCHEWGWVALVPGVLGLLALSPARGRRRTPSSSPDCPGRVSRPVRGRADRLALLGPARRETPRHRPTRQRAHRRPLRRIGITGDWLGARDALFDEGIDLRTNLSQFYQGVTSGGLRQTFPYGLKFDYFGTIEAEKLFGWEGLFVNLHGESRFGQSINRDVGSLVPANFALEFPKPTGSASALTNMQIEQFLGPDFVVTFGKLNAADGVNIHPFLGGNGINRFMNEAFVLSPIYGRTIPYSTPGAGFSYLRDLDPVFTFLVLDSNGRPDTSGLSRMFSNGATLFATFACP